MEPVGSMHYLVMNLSQLDGQHLLVIMNYYSNYIWTAFLMDHMSQTMIAGLMLVFR